MLLSVYVINSVSGLCILSWSRLVKKLDASLISGFLLAISRFGREIGGDDARFIDYGEKKFLFASKDELIFVLELTSAKDMEIGRRLLQQIITAFYREYGDSKELIKSVNLTLFLPFSEKIEQIISSQVIELEKILEDIQIKSKASGIILLNLGGGVLSATPKNIVELSETFISAIKMVLNSYEAATNDISAFEFIINGPQNTLYVRRILEDNFLLIQGSKEMTEGVVKVLVQKHLDEIVNILTTVGYIGPKTVATETIIQEFLKWSSKHSLLSELNLKKYAAQLDTIITGQDGLYEFDCILKSQTTIAFIRIYYKELGQSDREFIQRFVNNANMACKQLDFTPVLFLAISLTGSSEGAREAARQAIIRYKDKYFKLVLCKYAKRAKKAVRKFQIIEGL